MADTTALKNRIRAAIKANDNQEITGPVLQQALLDIVDELDLYPELENEATARGNADTQLNNLITGIKNNIDNGYVYAGIATPSSTPTTGKVFYLALTAGTYTNFGATVVLQGINILKYNGTAWSLDSFLGLDDVPTQDSSNLVKSGGVLDSIIKDGSAFDLSAYNNNATYPGLSAALTALDTLPAAYKKGGMSIKFVQSSNSRYVQYRLMTDSWSTVESNWQGVDDEPISGSNNLVKSGGVYKELIKKLEPKIVEEKGLFICDKNGKVLAEFTAEGFDTNLSQSLINKIVSIIPNDIVETIENGVFFCNNKGQVFAEYKNGKFNAIGIQAEIEKLEDIGNVGSALPGQVLVKQANGNWEGGSATINNTYNINQTVPESLEALDDVDANPSEGDILKYTGGKWVNAHISLDGAVTTDSRANHPMYGKHFFVFGDSHTEGFGFGLWQRFCELTGAIYHAFIKKDGYFYTTTEFDPVYYTPINEINTGIQVNCDGFNWVNYANAAYTYAAANNFTIDYILVHNSHFNLWTVENEIPWKFLSSKYYNSIFESAESMIGYINATNWPSIIQSVGGINNIEEASIVFFYGGKQQTLNFSFTSGATLNQNTVVSISFGGTSQQLDSSLTAGMTLSECVDTINQWAFQEYSGWTNQGKGTTGNTNIVFTHSNAAGSYNDLNVATITVTNGSNLSVTSGGIVANTTDTTKASKYCLAFNSKDVSQVGNISLWKGTGGSIGWSYPNMMMGALQYMGEVSPSTKFVFMQFPCMIIKSSYVYADGSVNPWDVFNDNSYKQGVNSNISISRIAEIFGHQNIDAVGLYNITPFNAYPLYYDLNNAHMHQNGYFRLAECVARNIK